MGSIGAVKTKNEEITSNNYIFYQDYQDIRRKKVKIICEQTVPGGIKNEKTLLRTKA